MNVVRQRVISDMVHCIIYSIVKWNDAFFSCRREQHSFRKKNFSSLKHIA